MTPTNLASIGGLSLLLALTGCSGEDAPEDGGSATPHPMVDADEDGGADGDTFPETDPDGGAAPNGPASDAGSEAGAGNPDDDTQSDPEESARRVVGYLPVWRGVAEWAERVRTAKLTHLILAFANPGDDGKPALEASDGELSTLVANAHAAGTKVLVSIGGGDGSGAVGALLQAERVDGFVRDLRAYVSEHGLDGLDVDIEGSAATTPEYAPFVHKMRAALEADGKLLTAALATWFGGDIAAEALDAFDFINVMAYDHCGPWTSACEQATFDQAVADLTYFAERGIAQDKLVLGVPFYAHCWSAGGMCPAPSLTYREVLDAYPDAWQSDWLEHDGILLSYNGEATLERKVELSRAYGGIMIWELGQDTEGEHSLLGVVTAP